MYNYVITHVANTEALLAELETMAPTYVTERGDGTKGWSVAHTPVVKNQNGSLALSALSNSELAFVESMTTITNLGTYEEFDLNEKVKGA